MPPDQEKLAPIATVNRPAKEINWLTGIALFACLAILAYWVCWFIFPAAVQSRGPSDSDYAVYLGYNQAFPLPDAFVALAALLGAAGLRRSRFWGYAGLWLAAGGALFLGLEDLAYDLQHSMFTPLTSAALVELLIVLALLGLGPLVIGLLWRIRVWAAGLAARPGHEQTGL